MARRSGSSNGQDRERPYSPVSGEVVEVNGDLAGSPQLGNEQPYGEGWLIRLRLADPSESELLRDADGYRALIGG
ncbi:MAG: hypothetical protein R3C32_09025 [Chloroflexota bacterium]